MSPAAELRRAAPADAAAITTLVAECFAEYREFAPRGWQPPADRDAAELMHAALLRPATHGTVALVEGFHAGHCLWIPAVDSERLGVRDPRAAYLWHLFVALRHRGSALAADLLVAAADEATAAGYAEMRLLTPREHARARHFYEREGWTPLGDWGNDPDLRLSLVEYGRRLRGRSGQNGSR